MKKLIVGLTMLPFFVFTAESLQAQVRDSSKRDGAKKDTTMKETWPADTNGQNTVRQDTLWAPIGTVQGNDWNKDSTHNRSVSPNDTTIMPGRRKPPVPSRPIDSIPHTPTSPGIPNNPVPVTPPGTPSNPTPGSPNN